ncbi:hypothetical protein KAFR_0K02390 [Kazachstania africana CBS 2517]|uniref:Dolichyl-phosphate-mannose--protein mannosyltransferase n=1 Tax=Kazachstania africana (strain ATCC 22294 / BCRC 22015 / CBS 2517 / CECT 1963 / NBRC 1671 / NRRL Y-8276) TaxID=1071382 RepID=H2B1U5_KAZAF|nr:hypothetical protein KAFR_0K02390 [Kazachstania africana CBS 2517]CCF60595.1 hypothetical protein KAFR_0K02390 [Kazachstania africana CBS 2517]
MASVKKEKISKELEEPNVIELDVKKGPFRPYLSKTDAIDKVCLSTSNTEKLAIGALAAVASVVRIYKLNWPKSVVADEGYLGSIISRYVSHQFFIDSSPPLVSLIFSTVAKLFGFNGDFDFEYIGTDYSADVPYEQIRYVPAFLGVLTILLMFQTLRVSGVRMWIAFATSLAFTFENSFATVSRYMLPESPFVFFIALAAYLYKKSELYAIDSCSSYKFVIGSAIALGCSISTKWAGAFAIVWVGVMIVLRMIFLVGDLSKPVKPTLSHSIMKGLIVVIVPCLFYLFTFWYSFSLQTIDGFGSQLLSPEYKSTLEGNTVPSNLVADIGVGSRITLRHTGTTGGYLHSHKHMYPAGSEQQQVSLYPYADMNNEWTIELYDKPDEIITSFEGLNDTTKIRLKHSTHCRLHSHDHKAPASENTDWQKEVTCYGYQGFSGDANDDWIIEIDKKASKPGEAQECVKAIDSKFRLKHALSGCYLFSHPRKLPSWGFEQQEVTCAHNGRGFLTLWSVEKNEHPYLSEDAERVSYQKSSFFEKFKEIHSKMLKVDDMLTSSIVADSNPLTWPFSLNGVEFWKLHNRTVYFLGNAVMWWSVSAFIGIFGVLVAYELFAWQLGKSILESKYSIKFHIEICQYLIGYVINFIPFLFVTGHISITSYLPSYYFGILALGLGLDSVVSWIFRTRKHIGYVAVAAFVTLNIYFFRDRSALVYGSEWTRDLCVQSKWLESWDYNCDAFLYNYDSYRGAELPTKTTVFINTKSLKIEMPNETSDADVDSEFDKIMREPGEHVFVDQNGNPLTPEQAKAAYEKNARNEEAEEQNVKNDDDVNLHKEENQEAHKQEQEQAPKEDRKVEEQVPKEEVKVEQQVPSEEMQVEEQVKEQLIDQQAENRSQQEEVQNDEQAVVGEGEDKDKD